MASETSVAKSSASNASDIAAQYTILDRNFPVLSKLHQKLVKRANKIGIRPITLCTLSHGTRERFDDIYGKITVKTRTIEISGEAPIVNGWEFVATIQHAGEAGNIIRTVPTFENDLPTEFRTSDPSRCDHCKMNRRRTDTYVVKNATTGAFAQVGSNCLADFVGHPDIHGLATSAELFSLLAEACVGLDDDERGHGRGDDDSLVLSHAVSWAAEAMFRHGWVSRTKARDTNTIATVDVALDAMRRAEKREVCSYKVCGNTTPEKCTLHFTPSDRAVTFAETCLEWAPSWIERELKRDTASDYIWNMRVVLANDVMPFRSYGLAASVLGAYQRELEYVARKARENAGRPESKHLGNVGDKITLDLTVESFRYIDSQYGSTLLICYTDTDGNSVKWFASSAPEPAIGETAKLTGTVKKHDEYQGTKSTILTRVKPFVEKKGKGKR